jgi:hypothetical protein
MAITTELEIRAILKIDSRGSEVIGAWSAEQLQGVIWEIKELSLPVSFSVGRTTLSGTLEFVQPTPYELKKASLQV